MSSLLGPDDHFSVLDGNPGRFCNCSYAHDIVHHTSPVLYMKTLSVYIFYIFIIMYYKIFHNLFSLCRFIPTMGSLYLLSLWSQFEALLME